jgi:phosphatidylserine/phosphatidylglycerophosphate/cardiolipin synthase-like enzyme
MAHCVLALGPDTAGGLLGDLIEGAASRVDAAIYEVGPSYSVRLARARQRGVAVRLLLDAHAGANSTTARLLRGSGAEVRVIGGHPGVEGHWKLLLIDGTTLAVGSGNLVHRDAPRPGGAGTREWWAAVSGAPGLLRSARAVFGDAWREAKDPPPAWRRAVAPPPAVPPVGVPRPAVPSLSLDVPEAALTLRVGGGEVATDLAARIAAATTRALVIAPYVHARVEAVRTLLDALAAAQARGVEVRMLLGTPPDPEDARALHALHPALPVRVMDPARCTTGHAKGLVADGCAVAGSANWSGAGLGGNREAALSIEDARAADWFGAALDRDWRVSRPLR